MGDEPEPPVIHEKSMAAIVGTSTVSAELTVRRGLNDLRLTALGIFLTFSATLGVGLGSCWWTKLGLSALVFAISVLVLQVRQVRDFFGWLMFRAIGA